MWGLFFDIDETLTAGGFDIPQKNIDAMNQARREGHKIIINTGRALGNLPKAFTDVIPYDAIISGNGTAVTLGGEMVFKSFMDRAVFEKIAEAAFRSDCWALFEGVNSCYSITGRRQFLSKEQKDVSSYEELMGLTGDEQIQVCAVSKGFDESVLEELRGIMSVYEFNLYYDIVNKGCNKAKSMDIVLDYYGIPIDKTIAFGDSENDLQMLLKAGIGVAVANAQPRVLESADHIAPPSGEGGVGEAIEKFILRRKDI